MKPYLTYELHWADGPLLCLGEPLRVSSNELCLGGMAWSRHLSRLCGLPQPLTSVCFMTSGRNDDEEPRCGTWNTKCSISVRDMRQQLVIATTTLHTPLLLGLPWDANRGRGGNKPWLQWLQDSYQSVLSSQSPLLLFSVISTAETRTSDHLSLPKVACHKACPIKSFCKGPVQPQFRTPLTLKVEGFGKFRVEKKTVAG